MAAVSVRDLCLRFGAVSVIEKLSIEIQEGEFVVLLGPSGCGKSTLLNAIAGLLDIDEGQIWIGGNNVTWEEPKDRGIGMVFQSYSLYPRMSVEMNMSFGLKIAKTPKDEIARRVAKASKLLQLDPLLKRKPAELSGGQRQRVAIGRALVRNVDVYLFDEPLSNLDAKLRNELRVEIKKLHQDIGNTMIYVTHDQVEALTLADRIAVMRGGVIQQFAAPREIYHKPASLFVAGFIGSPAMNIFEGKIVRAGDGWRFEGGGIAVNLGPYEFTREAKQGEVVFGIRPEHLSLAHSVGNGAISGRVSLLEPMGGETILWAETQGRPVSVKLQGDPDVNVDDDVSLLFDAARAHVFEAATGARL